MDIREFLDQDQKKDLLRLLTAGSVDDGKSTLIGRLLFDSKKLYEDQLDALKRDSKREGHAGEEIDYALLLDGLKAEREQGITIDVAYRYFSTSKRKFIIADTPGHEQYTRNMVTGASTANLAIILIDARKGVITQTRRHTYLISLLGIKHVVLAVNKMDLMDYSQEVYDNICSDYNDFVTPLGISDVRFFPISALKGDNVVDLSDKMPWYHGKSVLEHLEKIHIASDRNYSDLRFPVQYVVRPSLDYRGFASQVASGIISKGDEVMVLPSRKKSFVKEIVTYDGNLDYAFPPQSVTITLNDEIDISRGDMLVHPNNLPKVDRHFEAMLVWMDESPMKNGTQFLIKHTSQTTKARIDKIQHLVDVNTLEKRNADKFELNEIGRVVITTIKPLFFDAYKKNRQTGSFIFIDPVTHNTCAVGMIIDNLSSDDLPNRIIDVDKEKITQGVGLILKSEYESVYQQKSATIWLSGLHGSGKNELAYTLQKSLFEMGAKVMLLDGKSIRAGLSKELDYTPTDRAEHMRRVAHICKLMNDQGILVVCSFISPDESVRNQVAEIIGEEKFNLVYLDSNVDFCRENDKYGLYEKADEGTLKYLPGVDMEYQVPSKPSLKIDASNRAKNLELLMNYLNENKIFPI
ncbi:MAG: sulfate adenylyltransferase subunit CysN [Bacteroidales bacterium]|nr:bifunctional sulfate adenylyltransferase subunit 1/adenylylsulfate kinase [Lentimicrobiaceae bacterium]MDG1136442.1 sulfate adenylyltransferase subunit CysN [Bacteroidales bacterium]MDG1902506.1 sulfate adenylyltransferase subunit CysN [Bacteroidales bacterium]|tara:strand:- start:2144 stop:4048 length:1905 start_codon:yes stop_codon:yes gene_type:complete